MSNKVELGLEVVLERFKVLKEREEDLKYV